jgi:hypothetical protein
MYRILSVLASIVRHWFLMVIDLSLGQRIRVSSQRSIEIHYNAHPTYSALLADQYNTDKGTLQVPDNKFPWSCHTYSDLYELLFLGARHNVKTVFECGIGSTDSKISDTMSATGSPGASLRMWAEYFPKATVYGADIDKSVLFSDERIVTHWVDQLYAPSIEAMWNAFSVASFDLMIDDGLHTFDAGKSLFENSIHKLSTSGLYIIEDVTFCDMTAYKCFFEGYRQYNAKFIFLKQKGIYHRQNNIIIVTKSEVCSNVEVDEHV